MKNLVGILSVPRADNYGSVLQCYALQQVLDKMGISNEIIDYVSPFLVGRYKVWNVDSSSVKSWIISNIKSFLLLEKEISKKHKFQEFRKKYMVYSDRTVYDKKDIDEYPILVCGSDQIWNTRITEKDSAFFLDFASNHAKKIAYAVSLGYIDRTEEEVAFYKKYMEDFLSIGVRESTDVEFVRKCIDGNARIEHVLDPTLLLEKKEWQKFLGKKEVKEKYILAFIFMNDRKSVSAAKEISDKTGLPVYIIAQGVRRYNKDNFKVISHVGPIDWLNLIEKAEFVVTNSFHGTAFSVGFEKQFVSIPYEGTENRMLSLLSLLGLEDRISDGHVKYSTEIDYKRVRGRLEEARKRSYEFLEKAIKEN